MDIPEAFDQGFAELLATLLYKQTDLRTQICNGLQLLVESHQAFLSSEMPEKDQETRYKLSKGAVKQALSHLASFASNLLAVLFNVYGQTLPQYRGYILQCINAFLSIMSEPVRTE